jgi:hypothetical protein
VLVVLFEYDARSTGQPLFARAGVPRQLSPDDFSSGVLQRAVRGQAGVQVFCHEAERAFCLYVVLGSFTNRQRLVPRVNEVLAALDIAPVSGATTVPPPSTTPPAAPGTAPPTTTAPSSPGNTTTTTEPRTSTTNATETPPTSKP